MSVPPDFVQRFEADKEAATKLISVGESKPDGELEATFVDIDQNCQF